MFVYSLYRHIEFLYFASSFARPFDCENHWKVVLKFENDKRKNNLLKVRNWYFVSLNFCHWLGKYISSASNPRLKLWKFSIKDAYLYFKRIIGLRKRQANLYFKRGPANTETSTGTALKFDLPNPSQVYRYLATNSIPDIGLGVSKFL